jgi:hypothetical protein
MRPFYIACIAGASVLGVVLIIVCITVFGSEAKYERDRLRNLELIAQMQAYNDDADNQAGVVANLKRPNPVFSPAVDDSGQPIVYSPHQPTQPAPDAVSAVKTKRNRSFNLKKSTGTKLSLIRRKKKAVHESIPMPKHIRHTASPILLEQARRRHPQSQTSQLQSQQLGSRGLVFPRRLPRQSRPMTNIEFNARQVPPMRAQKVDLARAVNSGMHRRVFGTASGRPVVKRAVHKSNPHMFRPRMPAEMF